MKKNKAVFLDRDGTLIIDAIYLNDPKKIQYLEGVFEGLKQIQDKGFKLLIVTNQSGVARGIVQIENLDKIHQTMRDDFAKHGVEISYFYYAPYSVESNHWMRKPNPGMLEAGVKDFDLDPTQCWMVGDRSSDIAAGNKMGIRSIFLTGTEEPRPEYEFVASDFLAVTEIIKKNG